MYWIFFLFLVGFYYYPRKKEEKEEKEEVREVPYENKYMLKSVVEESEELKKIGVVEEETPEGKVRMKFEQDKDKEKGINVFLYWSNRPIQYKYLETVARKYVIVYDCREHYINIFEELAKASVKPVNEMNKPDVFASFKTYNTKRKQLKNRVVNEKSNTYVWKGKLSEYEVPKQSEMKNIQYSDFKKMK
jgi:hypothetical protein